MRARTLTLLATGALFCGVAAGADGKRRVAVLDFDFGTVQQWWSGYWDIGKGVSDLIVTELVNDGTYRVVERKHLDSILSEQNFSTGDRADSTTAARIGQILGVDAIIVGSVTQFGTEQKETKVGALLGKLTGHGGANVGISKGKALVAIDARMIDVNTAEILAVAKGLGQSSRSGLLLSGIGASRGGYGIGGFSMGSSNFRETLLGEAVYKAVADLSAQLNSAQDRLPERELRIEGLVAYVDRETVIVNIGSAQGLSVDDVLQVLRVTRTVKDPASGEILRQITSEIGSVRVLEVDERSAIASIVSGWPEVGDIVKNQ